MQQEMDWVKDLVIYQIYPRSFCDSNGDGVGDLPGILQKLDYLEELGVNAVWLSPVYRSPNDDNGYDISNYQEIMEEFGTMEDWERLRDACHSKGIRLIMDLVVNHSSDEHRWFQESRCSRENPKSDYYIWRDPVGGKEPNNWSSAFGGSAWEYVPERGQYYLHLFSKKQPDLNWACPELREEIYRMMEWWVERGVDGFRVDAISYLDKPEDFPDSPTAPEPDGYSFCIAQLAGRPGTHAYIREMNERIFSKYHVMTVGEVAAATSLELMNYVRTARREFDMAIPFVPPKVEISTWSPGKLKRDLRESYEALRDSGWWARFFSNHDKPRQVSLYGDDGRCWEVSAKLLAMLLHTLPGTPFLYQGEEIGMTNVRFPSIELYDDPDAKNCYRQTLLEGASEEEALRQAQLESRDNARTPMQWDSSPQAGFTVGTPIIKQSMWKPRGMTLIPFCSATGGFFPCGGSTRCSPGEIWNSLTCRRRACWATAEAMRGKLCWCSTIFPRRGQNFLWTWYRRRRRSCSPAMTVKAGMEGRSCGPMNPSYSGLDKRFRQEACRGSGGL